jgi:hypothetical protein
VRPLVVLGLLGLLLTGCALGDAGTTTTLVPTTLPPVATTVTHAQASPEDAVGYWIDSLVLARYDTAGRVVEPDQFLLTVAAEGFSSDLYDRFIAQGVPTDVRLNYWSSFVAGFEGISGERLDTLAVGPSRRFTRLGRTYAGVDLVGPNGEAAVIMAVYDLEEAGWYVDLIASFGSNLAPLFSTWYDQLPPDSSARERLMAQLPSWEVAAARVPEWDIDSAAAVAEVIDRLSG